MEKEPFTKTRRDLLIEIVADLSGLKKNEMMRLRHLTHSRARYLAMSLMYAMFDVTYKTVAEVFGMPTSSAVEAKRIVDREKDMQSLALRVVKEYRREMYAL
jgi:hypothetical protein